MKDRVEELGCGRGTDCERLCGTYDDWRGSRGICCHTDEPGLLKWRLRYESNRVSVGVLGALTDIIGKVDRLPLDQP
jgi:hypothetical protein